MKAAMTMLAALFSFSALAVDYPVKHIRYISDFDYREEVQDSKQYVVMVFSSKQCLESAVVTRDCWLFEKKLDYFAPSFSSKVKMVGFNGYFENYMVISQFHINRYPTVIILKDNQMIERIEPTYLEPDMTQYRLGWQDEMLKTTVETIYKIR